MAIVFFIFLAEPLPVGMPNAKLLVPSPKNLFAPYTTLSKLSALFVNPLLPTLLLLPPSSATRSIISNKI